MAHRKLLEEEIHECYYCGKQDGIGHVWEPEFHIGLLYIHNNELHRRELACDECHTQLSKDGKCACKHRHSHHIGSTCPVCGQKD